MVIKVPEPTRFAVWWKIQDGVTQPLVYAVIAVFIEVVVREIITVEITARVIFRINHHCERFTHNNVLYIHPILLGFTLFLCFASVRFFFFARVGSFAVALICSSNL